MDTITGLIVVTYHCCLMYCTFNYFSVITPIKTRISITFMIVVLKYETMLAPIYINDY